MRRLRRWGTLVAVVVVCVATALSAKALAEVAWNGVVGYVSPYNGLDLPPASHGSAEVTRTVVVIIDGLRVDSSRTMGTLNALRVYGADLVLDAPQPSLSYPNWTTLLSGAPPWASGVVTNWHEGPARVETIFDTARRAGVPTVFVGPKDFDALYGVAGKTRDSFMLKWQSRYLTSSYIDEAIRLLSLKPRLLVIHLPDVDEAGHAFGGSSAQYARAVGRVDADLNRLVKELSDGETVFVVTSDHGHIDAGGHGGWEPAVTQVPCVIAGPGVKMGSGRARQVDVASSVALLAGIAPPRMSTGLPVPSVRAPGSASAVRDARAARSQFDEAAADAVLGPFTAALPRSVAAGSTGRLELAKRLRADSERLDRLPFALLGVFACLAAVVLVGVASWRALAAATAGAIAYYLTFLALFFGVHRYEWSLSAFNSEDRISAWMNGRLIEAAVATVVAAAVASVVYPYLRRSPKPAEGPYLPGWLTLGPSTALVVLATIGLQVAWFFWRWGIVPTWTLPDLHWGFKFDVDLLQATAVGLAAVITPLVSFLVGRYHPRVRISPEE